MVVISTYEEDLHDFCCNRIKLQVRGFLFPLWYGHWTYEHRTFANFELCKAEQL